MSSPSAAALYVIPTFLVLEGRDSSNGKQGTDISSRIKAFNYLQVTGNLTWMLTTNKRENFLWGTINSELLIRSNAALHPHRTFKICKEFPTWIVT